MKTSYFPVLVLSLAVLTTIVEPVFAQEYVKPKQFIYVLRLVPRLHDDKSWTDSDKAAVERHFNRLKDATKTGQVFLAGRTPESGDKTFGIVIFEAANEEAARVFMNGDPAVIAGIMTAELHPFGIALQREKR